MKKNEPVSIIIGMRNSKSTITLLLKSILKQKYPIREIIVIDNRSQDNSVDIVLGMAKKTSIPIKVIIKKEDKGIGSSYNLGVKKAKSPYVVLMHSDTLLVSKNELEKLTKPFRDDPKTVASCPNLLLPKKLWEKYNFWEKCLFSRAVGNVNGGMNGKFDCIKKDVFQKIGGSNEKNFGENIKTGGEDIDLALRLNKVGKVILSQAKIIHLHYLGDDYKLSDWIINRKSFAKTYGTLLKLRSKVLFYFYKSQRKGSFSDAGIFIVLVKPILAILPFIPGLHFMGIMLLFIYAFFNSQKMYTNASTLFNPRIILLPFVDIFLVYYETFWMLDAFIFTKKQ